VAVVPIVIVGRPNAGVMPRGPEKEEGMEKLSVSILQTWTYRPQKRQVGSAFALTYRLFLRSCKLMGVFLISPGSTTKRTGGTGVDATVTQVAHGKRPSTAAAQHQPLR